MTNEIPKEMVGAALTNALLSLYDICNIKEEDKLKFDRIQHLLKWYVVCLEKGLPFSFELVARMGWTSRHSIPLFREQFSSEECRKELYRWAKNDSKMRNLLKELDLKVFSVET